MYDIYVSYILYGAITLVLSQATSTKKVLLPQFLSHDANLCIVLVLVKR